jgi:hypothetical protein
VTDWYIRIPHRTRGESLATVARQLRAEDRDVARALVLAAAGRGIGTAGALLDELQAMTQAERREILDSARAEVGLPATSVVDVHREISRVNPPAGLQACHSPTGCSAIPTTASGSWAPVRVRKWYCEEHRRFAAPGDMTDLGAALRMTESGTFTDITVDGEHEAEESRRRRQQAQRADREAALVEHEALERGRRDQLRAELPDHLKDTAA